MTTGGWDHAYEPQAGTTKGACARCGLGPVDHEGRERASDEQMTGPEAAAHYSRLQRERKEWGEVAMLPRGKYRVEEREDGWHVYSRDGGSFS